VFMISMVFTTPQIHAPLVILVVAVLTAFLFSLAGLINAVFARSFDDISIIPTFVLTPLTYLGGIFYSISLLPAFWQNVSLANPILYMINSFRLGFLGISDIPLGSSLLVIVFFIIVLMAVSLRLLKRGTGIRS